MVAILLSKLLGLNSMFFFQGIFLSIWTVGFKKTFTELVPRFPGLFLFPIFGLFTFGPKSQENCQCPSYGKNEMQVSFTHTYVNFLLWGLGFFGVALYVEPWSLTYKGYGAPYMIILPPGFMLFLLLLTFHVFEKKCCISCCSSCCLPFTERSVFPENSDQKDTEQQQQQQQQQQSEGDLEMMQIA